MAVMIKYTQGNILADASDAVVNTVNCVGIMGRGIALQFKEKFPENFKRYAAACKRGEVQPGRMFVYDNEELTAPRYLINFPTKRDWRSKSRIEDIRVGLQALVDEVRARGIRSIAIPPLGSGLGGLDWRTVKPLIEQALSALPDVDVTVYEPGGGPSDARPNRSRNVVNMTAGRAALVSLMHRYLGGLMDPSISLLEVHKLMYFLQAAGEPLKLRYVKAPYGPYAENLRHVLREVEGQLIKGYKNDGDAPDTQLALLPGAVEDADAFLRDHAQTHDHLDHVGRLVAGFETAFGLELLATVHWVAATEHAASTDAIVKATHDWGERKNQFTPGQIRRAHSHLATQGWLPAA